MQEGKREDFVRSFLPLRRVVVGISFDNFKRRGDDGYMEICVNQLSMLNVISDVSWWEAASSLIELHCVLHGHVRILLP